MSLPYPTDDRQNLQIPDADNHLPQYQGFQQQPAPHFNAGLPPSDPQAAYMGHQPLPSYNPQPGYGYPPPNANPQGLYPNLPFQEGTQPPYYQPLPQQQQPQQMYPAEYPVPAPQPPTLGYPPPSHGYPTPHQSSLEEQMSDVQLHGGPTRDKLLNKGKLMSLLLILLHFPLPPYKMIRKI